MKQFFVIIGDCLLIGLGAWSVYMFANIIWNGKYYVYEPSAFIRWSEFGFAILIVLFGLYHFLSDINSKN